jgi:hypothetical protein
MLDARSKLMKVFTLKNSAIFLGFIVHIALLIRYQSQMRDFGDFVKAGELIWENTNPYTSLMYVNSPVSAVLAYGLNKILPFIFFPAFWQILNIVGIFAFFRLWLRKEASSNLLLAISLLSLLNVTRALVANVQVTGLVLGAFALGVMLSRKGKSPFLVMFPIWVAAEIKPQLALGLIVFFLFHQGINFARIAILTFYVFISHLLVEFKYSGFIHSEWIEKVLNYSKTSLNEGYEVSYWKGIALTLGEVPAMKTISVLILIINLGFILYMSIKSHTNWAIFGALVLPFQNTYLHLYDLAPLGVLVILGVLHYSNYSIVLLAILFVQVFPMTLETQFIVVFFFFLIILIKDFKTKTIPKIFAASALVLLIGYLSATLLDNRSEEVQIIFSLVFPSMLLLFINARKFANLFELGSISR